LKKLFFEYWVSPFVRSMYDLKPKYAKTAMITKKLTNAPIKVLNELNK
jgi:hypothetical protein